MTRQLFAFRTARTRAGKARLVMILAGFAVLAACVTIRYYWGIESAQADSTDRSRVVVGPTAQRTSGASASNSTTRAASSSRPRAASDEEPKAGESAIPEIVALVNGRQVTRDDLARECLRHYGEEVLENLINKYLIAQQCKQRGITITHAEVETEIDRMAKRFKLPRDQWLKLLQVERGISAAQYANDIIWPTLALRRLAGEQLEVSPEEMRRAYELKYGPAVKARLIACKDRAKAEKAYHRVKANPEDFGNVAKELSDDASAADKGVIQPIRKHGSYPQIEQAVFSMGDGDVSPIIQAGGQYVILRRERLLPGARAVNYELVAPQLEQIIRDQKLRKVSNDIFAQLQEVAKVQNVMNDPARRPQMPGVAALVNGRSVSIAALSDACIERHGEEVLEGVISRKLLEIECEKRRVKITEEDIDREVARVASFSVPPKDDGSADVEKWLALVTEEQGVSIDVYRRDTVWPSLALQKLVGDRVVVAPADIRKGFEANYGPRVRCLAIVMNNQRRAIQVWEMARKNPTVEYFGDLAEEYSIEPSSRALRGEVPPIRKYGGQPDLEKEAFELKPGELSAVIQMGERYIVLYCLGQTESTGVKYEEVKDELYQVIYEKKQRLAMGQFFEQLQQLATIDNFLAGTSQRPRSKAAGEQSNTALPTLREVGPRR